MSLVRRNCYIGSVLRQSPQYHASRHVGPKTCIGMVDSGLVNTFLRGLVGVQSSCIYGRELMIGLMSMSGLSLESGLVEEVACVISACSIQDGSTVGARRS